MLLLLTPRWWKIGLKPGRRPITFAIVNVSGPIPSIIGLHIKIVIGTFANQITLYQSDSK